MTRMLKQYRLQTRNGVLFQGWMTEEELQELKKAAELRTKDQIVVKELNAATVERP
jgi:hypothetical protein